MIICENFRGKNMKKCDRLPRCILKPKKCINILSGVEMSSKIHEKAPTMESYFIKLIASQVLFREICENFPISFFTETLGPILLRSDSVRDCRQIPLNIKRM